jgi:hypothetical protein
MKNIWLAGLSAAALASTLATGGIAFDRSEASDHDDGDDDLKSRALNLTDHFAFKSPEDPSQLSLVMYLNPRSLPGRQYFLSPNVRYEFHVSKAASRTTAPTLRNDFVFRFEAKAPDASEVQDITLTVLRDGEAIGTVTGKSTSIAGSKNDSNLTINTGTAGDVDVTFFVGMRADSFHFDVNRFFQVRAFLAGRFFGKGPTRGNAATPAPAPNCEGDAFLAGAMDLDGDEVNLFNPPSCAPDFTKTLNVTAIVLNVPIAQLGGTVFDTWSTISVKQ